MAQIYDTLIWRAVRARALARDGHRCTVSRLLGGPCAVGPLHVHHIEPVDQGGAAYDLDNLGTTCARHHPKWEALRRAIVGGREARRPARCTHRHASAEARLLCERRLARQRQLI